MLFWVPLPPPYGGPAVASALLMAEVSKLLPDCVVKNSTVRRSIMAKGRFDLAGLVGFVWSYARFTTALVLSRCRIVYLVLSPNALAFVRDSTLIWTAALLRKRVAVHLRGGNYANLYSSSPRLLRLLIRHTCRRAACAIVQSENLRQLMSEYASDVPVSVLPNGLPATWPAASDGPDGAGPGLSDARRPVTLLFVAYLTYTKGFYDLIAVYHNLRRRYGDGIQLSFAGERPRDGVQFSAFLSGAPRAYYLANLSEIEQRIDAFVDTAEHCGGRYAGVVAGAEKEALFRQADIFVLPSYMEGFSMAVLEAMFAGLPVVSTNVGSNPDVIAEGQHGFLTEPGDQPALEAAISRLIDDPELRRRMGRRNAEEARKRYRLDVVAERMVAILGGA